MTPTTWIPDPSFVPTWNIGSLVTYPSDLRIRAIVESDEFSGLPMVSCEYITDSPALLEPDFSGKRVLAPYDAHSYQQEFSISTDFSVSEIYRGEDGIYRYRLTSVQDQLLFSPVTLNYYLRHASGFTQYQDGYSGMEALDFVIIAQGIEDYVEARQ